MAKVYFEWGHLGAIEHEDGSTVATKFFQVQGLPLFPSTSVHIDRDGNATAIPLHLGSSLLAAWRGWGVIIALWMYFRASGSIYSGENTPLTALAAPLMALAITASWFASLWIGKRRSRPKPQWAALCAALFLIEAGLLGYRYYRAHRSLDPSTAAAAEHRVEDVERGEIREPPPEQSAPLAGYAPLPSTARVRLYETYDIVVPGGHSSCKALDLNQDGTIRLYCPKPNGYFQVRREQVYGQSSPTAPQVQPPPERTRTKRTR